MIDPLPIHGGQLQHLAARFGIPAPQLLDFSANINPEGPSGVVLSTLRESLEDRYILTSYPDIEEKTLKRAIADNIGVLPQSIAVANGFIPLLEAVLRALPIRSCLLPVPAFVEYRKALTRAQVEITPYFLTAESNFQYNAEAMVIGQQDAILLANPQNPSGVACSRETLLQIAARATEQNIYILLDEAFIDYLPQDSLAHDIDRFPNLIVFRSVTKFYGIPGLRVAYAVANPGIIRLIDENLPPWLISTLASRAVAAALKDVPYANRSRSLNRQRRVHLQTEIEALGVYTYPSAANFLLLCLPSHVNSIVFWERMIVKHRIVLRSCANYEALAEGHLRAAVRSDQENVHLIHALSRTLVEFGQSVQSQEEISHPQPRSPQMTPSPPSFPKPG